MLKNEQINNETMSGDDQEGDEQFEIPDRKFEDVENEISNEADKTIKAGEKLLVDVESGSNLNHDELSKVRIETGIAEKMKSIKEAIVKISRNALRELRVGYGISPLKKDRFNPNEEVINVLKSSKKDRLHKLDDFYESYFFQQKGLIEVQDKILKNILINPEKTATEIFQENENYFDRYGLTNEQRVRIAEVLRNYQEKHERVVNIVGETDNPVDLFEKLFKFKPVGNIKMKISPVSIGFFCEDPRDYAMAKTGDHDNIEKLKTNGGVCINDHKIGASIILINSEVFKEGKYYAVVGEAAVIAHEEQHAIYRLFHKETYNPGKQNQIVDEVKGENDPVKRELLIDRYLRLVIDDVDFRMANEIIARYKEGDDPNNVLAQMNIRGGDYDFLEYARKRAKEVFLYNIGSDNEELIDKCIKNVYGEEYYWRMRKAIESIYSIELSRGMTADKVIALFQNEPTKQWPKIVKRIRNFYPQK